MKIFIEVHLPLKQQNINADMIVARLASIGFDGFLEETDQIVAYREKGNETIENIEALIHAEGLHLGSVNEMADQNWNAQWEAQYEAVVIKDSVRVRAPFHPPASGIPFDIIIEPRMSFGTAHHETTALMLEFILGLECRGKSVLDMGCGTAVLAVLAQKKGAAEVVAIDNDEWAFNNAMDNVKLNNAADIKVELGDASSIGLRRFQIIFANINRNILLEDIPAYSKAVEDGGSLLMSGFYEEDLPLISEKCLSSGLAFGGARSRNRWTAALYNKI